MELKMNLREVQLDIDDRMIDVEEAVIVVLVALPEEGYIVEIEPFSSYRVEAPPTA